MRKVIHNALEKCVGCNHCVRVCPVEEANIVREVNGKIIVEIDNCKCIVCGACQDACHHGSRYYEDDTERFFADLKRGEQISMFTAPAMKTNFDEWGRIITWLRTLGVDKIYDVSLGADICTWAHIRHIEQNGLSPIISQPCPVIVNYILMHRSELAARLSPIHSPMLCTAIYMREYEGVTGKIAALSPCAAKGLEFEAVGIVEYNVTIRNFYEYIEKNGIVLPETQSGFDHYEAGLGSIYPMPGGLKENIEHYYGKTLRIDRSECSSIVYKSLDEYTKQPYEKLPVLFDVLNCAGGCNRGTGCRHDRNVFEINTKMDGLRQTSISSETGKLYLDSLFTRFDKELRRDDFVREYTVSPVKEISVTRDDIEAAFNTLGKLDEESRYHDCGACGCDRCTEMARQIAKNINIPKNCAAYVKMELEHTAHELNIMLKNHAETLVELENLALQANCENFKTKAAHDEILSGLLYASNIQKNLLPETAALQKVFSDCSVIWNPANIVGGDIYWIKQFDKGTVLCVCDCTGHGTSGALLTMLVVSALESVVSPVSCDDTASIVWRLDKRLAEAFGVKKGQKTGISDIKDGCDIAVLFIAPDGSVDLSSGQMGIFVCNGSEVRRIKGQKIFIGEGKLRSSMCVNTIRIPADPENKFYIASDGLFDQPGEGCGAPFGYKRFEKIIFEHHGKTQSAISDEIWHTFEAHRGIEPRVDDFELITFKI